MVEMVVGDGYQVNVHGRKGFEEPVVILGVPERVYQQPFARFLLEQERGMS